MKKIQHLNLKFYRLKWFTLLIAIIVISGCGPLKVVDVQKNISVSDVTKKQSLENGYKAFFREDFKQASNLFKLSLQSDDSDLSKKAQFAFNCTQLILTDTSKEFRAAVKRLEALAESEPVQLGTSEFKVLSVLLKHIGPQDQEEDKSKAEIDVKCAYQYRESINLRDEEIDRLNQKIKAIKAEAKTLKNKIKSIEEIDQKIQEKKNPTQHRKLF